MFDRWDPRCDRVRPRGRGAADIDAVPGKGVAVATGIDGICSVGTILDRWELIATDASPIRPDAICAQSYQLYILLIAPQAHLN